MGYYSHAYNRCTMFFWVVILGACCRAMGVAFLTLEGAKTTVAVDQVHLLRQRLLENYYSHETCSGAASWDFICTLRSVGIRQLAGEAPCIMTIFVRNYWELLLLRLLTGISLGGIFPLVRTHSLSRFATGQLYLDTDSGCMAGS